MAAESNKVQLAVARLTWGVPQRCPQDSIERASADRPYAEGLEPLAVMMLAADLVDARAELRRLRALRAVIREGYRVHRGCGGEVDGGVCQACERRVAVADVLTPERACAELVGGA